MKITIEYNTENPGDKRLLDLQHFAQSYNCVLFDVTHNLKDRVEQRLGNTFDDETFEETIEQIWEMIEDNGLTEQRIDYHANG